LEPLRDPQEDWLPADTYRVPVRHRKFQDRIITHLLLFVLTVGTTWLIGVLHYLSFIIGFEAPPANFNPWQSSYLVSGLWYSVTVLAILGAHEFGHYFACRYYDVDASLPYFLPAPPPLITGTLGAIIRIREPFPSKRALFDIGVAGPIAGFLVLVPALFLGLSMSTLVRLPAEGAQWWMGEPLLMKLALGAVWGERPPGFDINLHPVAFAAWFGMLATALNLFPFGQLDGGHLSYAVLGRRSAYVSVAAVLAAVGLCFISRSWVLWTIVMVVMVKFFGLRHPPVFDEDAPLDRTRLAIALLSVVIFALCFTPIVMEPMELVAKAQ
jgi:membrane-associated protease RseP (regulator of RpoE activity)